MSINQNKVTLKNMKFFKSKNLKSGFTLIELLVVVAIIGILASVVLASLGNARGKASDSKIKAQLASMRNQAELYSVSGAVQAVVQNCPLSGTTLFGTLNNGLGFLFGGISAHRCAATAGNPSDGNVNWAVGATLSSGFWCVDSTGWSSDRSKAAIPVVYGTLASTITTTLCN